MKIGYIGLGAMGEPMARRLCAAYPGALLVYDQDPELTARVAEAIRAEAAPSIPAIAEQTDVLLTCLPNNDVVRSVYLGHGGITTTIRAGTVTIDCSTVGPDASRDVAGRMAGQGVSHLDASMLGSVKQANEGTISFVVGGDADVLERVRPVLAACGGLIRHCGPSGAGNQMKLVHQTLVAGHAVAVAEAIGLCLETGTDLDTFYEIVTQGTGFAYSRYFENRVPRMRSGDFSAQFMLKFMLKDARLARDMVEDADRRYPALDAVIESLEEGVAAGWGEADFSAAMKAVEARTGRRIDG